MRFKGLLVAALLVLLPGLAWAQSSDFIRFYPPASSGTVAASVPFVLPHTGDAVILRTDGDGEYGDFKLTVEDTIFAGDLARADRVYALGYNPGRVVATEPELTLSMESYYHDGVNPTMELYYQYLDSAGGNLRRPYFWQIKRDTHASLAIHTANSTTWKNDAGAELWNSNSTGIFQLTASTAAIYKQTNNQYVITQGNSAAANIGLLKLDSTDRLQLGQVTASLKGVEALAVVNYYRQDASIADSGGAGAKAYTLTPSQSYVKMVCNDADGCNITMDETGAVYGRIVHITNSGANVCNFADTSGVSELFGAFAMGQYDSLTLIYDDDRWTELARSNN